MHGFLLRWKDLVAYLANETKISARNPGNVLEQRRQVLKRRPRVAADMVKMVKIEKKQCTSARTENTRKHTKTLRKMVKMVN